MFGLSISKIIFTTLVVYIVWKAFKVFARLQSVREHRAAMRSSSQNASQQGIEDMVACSECNAYVTRGAKSCGKNECPFRG